MTKLYDYNAMTKLYDYKCGVWSELYVPMAKKQKPHDCYESTI